MNREDGGIGFREDVGLQGWDGEVVAEFLDFVIATGVGAEDFEDHARGIGEERVTWYGNADDHTIGVIECFFVLAEGDAEFEVAAGGEAGFSGELSLSEIEEISCDSLMVESSAGHGIHISGDVFVTDFRGKFALEVIVSGDAVVCDCQCHADTINGISLRMQALGNRG